MHSDWWSQIIIQPLSVKISFKENKRTTNKYETNKQTNLRCFSGDNIGSHKTLNWDKEETNRLLSAFFYGYVVMQVQCTMYNTYTSNKQWKIWIFLDHRIHVFISIDSWRKISWGVWHQEGFRKHYGNIFFYLCTLFSYARSSTLHSCQ